MKIVEQDELFGLIKDDLKNEQTHMHFYLQSAALVRGLHRNHLRPFLEEEAASEMGHVLAFSKIVVSLDGVPTQNHHEFPQLTTPETIIEYAIKLEQEVVNNYAERLAQIGLVIDRMLDGDKPEERAECAQWTYIGQFYEDQIQNSHADLNELKEILKGL